MMTAVKDYYSRIVATLKAGSYKVFIRSYSSNAASTCDLYKDSVRVFSRSKVCGHTSYSILVQQCIPKPRDALPNRQSEPRKRYLYALVKFSMAI